jgi:hypothetical protein
MMLILCTVCVQRSGIFFWGRIWCPYARIVSPCYSHSTEKYDCSILIQSSPLHLKCGHQPLSLSPKHSTPIPSFSLQAASPIATNRSGPEIYTQVCCFCFAIRLARLGNALPPSSSTSPGRVLCFPILELFALDVSAIFEDESGVLMGG